MNGKDYTAFGETTSTAQRTTNLGYEPPNVRQGYTGYEKDVESGLEFAQARYYNVTHGRFTSVDPLMASASIKNPQTFNRYTYAMNSPYKYTDPLGLLSESIACGRRCSNSYNGGDLLAGAASGGNYQAEQPKQQHAETAGAPPAPEPQNVQEIPVPPKIIVGCEGCSEKQTQEFQAIADKLVAANWRVIYNQVLRNVAATRVPPNEITEQTDTSSNEISASTSGAEVHSGNSSSIKKEGLKSLQRMLETNEDYLNNSTIATQAATGVGAGDSADFVASINQRMITYADELLSAGDQSPPLPGSLPLRRGDPTKPLNPPRQFTPQERMRGLRRQAHISRSIYQE
jgi:RHS repeat-associated protein